MKLPGLYRMNEDGVYSSSVLSYPFWVMSISKQLVHDTILEVEEAYCTIGEVRG